MVNKKGFGDDYDLSFPERRQPVDNGMICTGIKYQDDDVYATEEGALYVERDRSYLVRMTVEQEAELCGEVTEAWFIAGKNISKSRRI